MQIVDLTDFAPYDEQKFVATGVLSGESGNVRIIRLAPGQTLPTHTHGVSDLFLYVANGVASFTEDEQVSEVASPALVQLAGSEELKVSNQGTDGVTLLAFLAPVFPPPAS